MGGMRENRTEPRAGTRLQVEIMWEDDAGNPQVLPAKLEDTSRSGAGIRLKQEIAAGTKIIVKLRDGQFSGTVVYCLRRGVEYVIGVRKDPIEVSVRT